MLRASVALVPILGPKEEEGEMLLDLREQGDCGVRSAFSELKTAQGRPPSAGPPTRGTKGSNTLASLSSL